MADRYAKTGKELMIQKMEEKVQESLGPRERPLSEIERQVINSHIELASRLATSRAKRKGTHVEYEYHKEMSRHAAKMGLRII